MLSFESQHEQDEFLSYCRTNFAAINKLVGNSFQFFLNMFAFVPGNATGFVWYHTGLPVSPKIIPAWSAWQPDNYANVEFCTCIIQPNKGSGRGIGMNDFSCADSDINGATSTTVVCQSTIIKKKGFEGNY